MKETPESAAAKTQALSHLQVLFPDADPGYLSSVLQYHLSWRPIPASSSDNKGKAKDSTAGAAELVQRVSQKMLELNHCEYPRTAWVPAQQRRAAGEKNGKVGGKLKDLKQVRQAWGNARGGSGEEERVAGGSRGPMEGPMVVDETLARNQALIRLHAIFPTTTIADLRSVLLTIPHSFLFTATAHFLQSSSLPSPPTPARQPFSFLLPRGRRAPPLPPKSKSPQSLPILSPSDLFRSPEYAPSLAAHLKHLFPLVPLSVIKSLAVEGGTYGEIRESVALWRGKQSWVKNWLTDIFVPPTGSAGSTSSDEGEEAVECEELTAEIWEYERSGREKRADEDERVARGLNESWTDEEQLFSCGCCFGDVPFEDIGVCAGGQHAFCRGCIGRQVEEHVFGGAPLRLFSKDGDGEEVGAGTGVRCLSIEGCRSPFTQRELERVLSPALLTALSQRLGEAALEAIEVDQARRGGESLVRCPWCPYTEVQDSSVLARAFPLVTQDKLTWTTLPWRLFRTLLSLVTFLLLLYPTIFFFIALLPTTFVPLASPKSFQPTDDSSLPLSTDLLFPLLEPHRVLYFAHSFLTLRAREILARRTGNLNVFHCRNGPSHAPLPPFGDAASGAKSHAELVRSVWLAREGVCGRVSCLSCGRAFVEGLHRCFEDEKEGLRLAVERAMSEAVQRICPTCGVAWQKNEGCNKVVCVGMSSAGSVARPSELQMAISISVSTFSRSSASPARAAIAAPFGKLPRTTKLLRKPQTKLEGSGFKSILRQVELSSLSISDRSVVRSI